MTVIDADVFLEYLIFSKHIDSLKCGEVKEAIEMSKVDVLDKIRAEIEKEIIPRNSCQYDHEAKWQNMGLRMALKVIDEYKAESEEQDAQ